MASTRHCWRETSPLRPPCTQPASSWTSAATPTWRCRMVLIRVAPTWVEDRSYDYRHRRVQKKCDSVRDGSRMLYGNTGMHFESWARVLRGFWRLAKGSCWRSTVVIILQGGLKGKHVSFTQVGRIYFHVQLRRFSFFNVTNTPCDFQSWSAWQHIFADLIISLVFYVQVNIFLAFLNEALAIPFSGHACLCPLSLSVSFYPPAQFKWVRTFWHKAFLNDIRFKLLWFEGRFVPSDSVESH